MTAHGTVISATTFDRIGSFATNVDVVPSGGVLSGEFNANAGANCRAFQAPDGTRRIDVDVTRVEFSDGSVWHAPFKSGMFSLPDATPRDDATDSPMH
jgi:hypothetical protein